MGTKAAVEEGDLLVFLSSKDRAFSNGEIAVRFVCSREAAASAVHRARNNGHVILPTGAGQWYLPGGIKKPDHLVAATQAQAWAANTSAKAQALAIQFKQAIGTTPRKLITQMRDEALGA